MAWQNYTKETFFHLHSSSYTCHSNIHTQSVFGKAFKWADGGELCVFLPYKILKQHRTKIAIMKVCGEPGSRSNNAAHSEKQTFTLPSYADTNQKLIRLLSLLSFESRNVLSIFLKNFSASCRSLSCGR